MGIEAESNLKERRQGNSYEDIASMQRQRKKKKSGLPLQSLSKKQRNYNCPLCKKFNIISTEKWPLASNLSIN